jgi:type IV pilus assembly protein PilV
MMRTSSQLKGKTTASAARQTGFSLIEVLVTTVIVSVGLLGIAALQLTSIRSNYSSFARGQASAMADDILDRIRANRDNAAAYTVALAATPAGTSRADMDIQEWKQQLAALLPQTAAGTNADASIQMTQLAGTNRFSALVTISWGERDSDLQFVTQSEI